MLPVATELKALRLRAGPFLRVVSHASGRCKNKQGVYSCALVALCMEIRLPFGMAIKFVVHGVEVTASNAAEAAALIRELGNAPTPQRTVIRAAPGAQVMLRHKGFDVKYAAVDFLSLIRNAGDNGISVAGLMPAVQARRPKGVGARAGMINKLLVELGFDPAQVYENPRTSEGRIWKAGPKMDAALEAVKRKAGV